MLCKQGRMHPEVALFANRAFYEGRLIPVGLPHQVETIEGMSRIVFLPSEAEPQGASAKVNTRKRVSQPGLQQTFTGNMPGLLKVHAP